jgi:hypothetical protein
LNVIQCGRNHIPLNNLAIRDSRIENRNSINYQL